MSPTAPVLSSDGTLWLAYRIERDPHPCAVVRFHRVEHYAWGAPPAVEVVLCATAALGPAHGLAALLG